MGIKLYVDDIRPAPKGWELCRTITKAIRLLSTTDVSEISLDHDIVFKRDKYNEGESETFEPVCRFVDLINSQMQRELDQAEGYFSSYKFIKVYCHSANPEAYKKYSDILGYQIESLPLQKEI